MTLVGELVLARNRLLPFAADHAETAYVAATQRLDTITTELQERVMKTRMQPISAIWSKFPRLVRDLAQACGKQVNLVLEGQGTELDRTLLEAVKDPLTHLIRNSVDHGIEPPRRAWRRANRRPDASCSAPATRPGWSSSRSPTTAAASTWRASGRKPSSAG